MKEARATDSNPSPEDFKHATGKPILCSARVAPLDAWSRIKSSYSNLKFLLRGAIAPANHSRFETTSSFGAVSQASAMDGQFTRVQALSLSFHVVILALIIAPLLPIFGPMPAGRPHTTLVSPEGFASFLRHITPVKDTAHGGGGGGERNPIPQSIGRSPIFWPLQLAPPAVKTFDDPKLAAPPTLVGPKELHLDSPLMNKWGDPASRVDNDSSGPGTRGGIGTGDNGGIGPGDGPGEGPGRDGGFGDKVYNQGTNGYGFATCIYCPNPQFSLDAIKAKIQGTVLFSATITADGRATNIRIVRGIGFGLDENAVEAVRHWRFRPALGPNHKPAAVSAPIEVSFHIY